MLNMSENSNALEGLKLISDWAKWLITIEAGAIAIIGAIVGTDKAPPPYLVKVFVTGAIICFLISIVAAALLLLSLPEIAQNLQPRTNIWSTQDSMIGRVFRTNIQGFAILESLFFGLGVVCFSIAIVVAIWSPVTSKNNNAYTQPSPSPVTNNTEPNESFNLTPQ
jgi:hypothetical protein